MIQGMVFAFFAGSFFTLCISALAIHFYKTEVKP